MRIRYAAKSDTGMKRPVNEDCFRILKEESLFVVCDGMGGHAAGEVASGLAADTVVDFFRRSAEGPADWPFKPDRTLGFVENRLLCGVKLANFRVYESAVRDRQLRGMGTTIVACIVRGQSAHLAHVGDSRGYRVRDDGSVQQVTRDHSLVEDFRKAGLELRDERRNVVSTPRNVITRALGMRDAVQVDITVQPIDDGDTILLCSDGLSGMVDDETIGRLVHEAGADVERAAADLIDLANENGGVDNVTALLLRCER